MTGFLRFVGLLNAAVWCGSTIFLFFGVPALFSPYLKQLLTPAGVGYAAEAILARYFILQYCCGAIAIAHMAAEWFYFGRRTARFDVIVVTIALGLALLGGLGLQPKMRKWHEEKYWGKTMEIQAHGDRYFGVWHGLSECANLVVVICLISYVWRVGKVQESPRFVSYTQMRG